MLATTSLIPILCALAVCAAPAPGIHNYAKRVVHSQRARPGKGFEIVPFVDQVKDDQVLTMAVRLTQSNPEGLESALADISNPDSPRYGQWLSREQIATFTRPTDETIDAVTRWLGKNGLNATRSELPEYIHFTVPIGQANSLLDAKYAAFRNSFTGDRLVRTLQYSLPEAMEPHIKTIYPGTSFFNPRAMPVNAVRPSAPPAATNSDSETIPVIVARANETLTLTVSQLTALWEAVQNQRNGQQKRAALAQHSSPPSDSVPALNSSLLVSSIFPSLSEVDKRQESPEEILRKLNETLGGTLPTGTRIVQVPDTGDLSGLDPTLADIIRGIINGQSVPQVPVPVPTQPPKPTVTITVTQSTSSIPTSSSSSSTPVPPVPTNIPIPVPRPGLTDASCSSEITPACLQQLYSIPKSLDVPQGPVGIAVTGYIDQYGQHEDLQKYLKEFRTDVNPSLTFETVSISGGINPQDGDRAGVEANLDLQYTIGVTPGIPVQFVTVGKTGTGNGFLDTITTMIAQPNVPEVVTTSYGQIEADVDVDVAEAMCDAYKQLTARGVSILFASGDSGVGDFNGECLADGVFEPTFPSGCPFITSVGSTDGVAPERAASFSSGGFSRHYPMPAYQQAHVQRYLQAHDGLYAGQFNPSGRAFPDVSLQGTKYAVVNGGEKILVQGTSASCPVFASMIALINAERHAIGMPPMGFLNPWLYGKASPAFIDITEGSNPGCGTEGFPAAPGWDPVTGLGTPAFLSLRAAAGLQ